MKCDRVMPLSQSLRRPQKYDVMAIFDKEGLLSRKT